MLFFYDGDEWQVSPVRKGTEVGWHECFFQALCHRVEEDLQWDQAPRPDHQVPSPTDVVIMPLNQSAIPLHALVNTCFGGEWGKDVVQVRLPLITRGASFPVVHVVT